jgi:hypothetical protein
MMRFAVDLIGSATRLLARIYFARIYFVKSAGRQFGGV